MSDTLAERLAAFALGTAFKDLPPTVVVEARRRLLDTLACAIGALDEPAPSIARRVAGRYQGTPSVSLIGGDNPRPIGRPSPMGFISATSTAMTLTCRSSRRTQRQLGGGHGRRSGRGD